MIKKLIAAILCGIVSYSMNAQEAFKQKSDSVRQVDEVVVTGRLTFQEVIPSQKMSGDLLERLNTHSVADALRYFSGLQIKDYGGVGGLKTVNIRSMGTNHLGIYYDGIELGNAQNGQVDLGQYSLDNVQEVSLYNGQKSAIFQTASDFGNAGSVYIRTRRPVFYNKKCNVKLKAKYASSDMLRLSALVEQKMNDKMSLSINTEVLTSSGKYKFRYKRLNLDNTVAYDTTAIRQNGDIWALRFEGNINGIISGGVLNAKVYTYHSERGIPGAIVNNIWRRGERQWDRNTFFQTSWQKSFGEKFSTRFQAKYALYNTRFVNNDTTQLHVDNRYRQQEMYISTSNVYEILHNWSISLSYDFKFNTLWSDMRQFVWPHRFTNLIAFATALDFEKIKIQSSILSSFVKNHTKTQEDKKAINVYTPAFFINYIPFKTDIISFRAFAKQSFRMPTFNDLYYTEIGNSNLKPEKATQYNIGAVVKRSWKNCLVTLFRLQTDAYYNTITDKIVAYPKGQQFRWTMLNLGKVHIKGIDIMAETEFKPIKDLVINTRLQYTYQDARDVTDHSDSYFNDQIPYIPYNSSSAIVSIGYKKLYVTYSFIYAGERYNQQENIKYNHMQPWYTSDLSLLYIFNIGKAECKATLEVNNLFSQDYDVILNYPMPKRNYGISLDIKI